MARFFFQMFVKILGKISFGLFMKIGGERIDGDKDKAEHEVC